MEFFARHSGLRRALALLLATLTPSACVTWRPVLGPQSYLAAEQQSHVRAVLSGGEVVDVYSPAVVGTDIVGYRHRGVELSRVTIPASRLRYVQVPHTAVGRTVLLAVTLSLAAFVAIGLATFQGMKGSGGFGGQGF